MNGLTGKKALYYPGYAEFMYNHRWFVQVLNELQEALPPLMKALNADTVVVTGKSGMSVAFGLMARMPLNLVVVRKENDNCHGRYVEGVAGPKYRAIMLDDLVDSGATLVRVVAAVEEYGVEVAGVLCYSEDSGLDPEPDYRKRPVYNVRGVRSCLASGGTIPGSLETEEDTHGPA